MAYRETEYERLLQAIGLKDEEEQAPVEIVCWNCKSGKGIRSPFGGCYCFECGASQTEE